MKTILLSILLLSTLNCEKFDENFALGPAQGGASGASGASGSDGSFGPNAFYGPDGARLSGPNALSSSNGSMSEADNVVIYQPANDSRIEPVVFNPRVGAPNLSRQEPTQLPNPIDSVTFPAEVPAKFAEPNAPTLLVFDENNAPDGLAEFLANNPGAQVADSIEAAELAAAGGAAQRPMFDVPQTVTVGVGNPPFPGFNNDVEHLPVTTLMKGEKPIDKVTYVDGVKNPSIPGRNIRPINISDMPPTSAIPVRSPSVPGQYKLNPGQAKQGLDFSTIAAAPKIEMPFAPIPNVTALKNKREPWNLINTRKFEHGKYVECNGPLANDCLIDNDTVIPVADKIITQDKDERDTKMVWPGKVPASYVRSTEPRIIRVDGDVDLVIQDSAPVEDIVGSSN